MKKIAIRYGEGPGAGNGHRVRMLRLAKALAQRGAEVDIRPANFVEILDTLKRGAHASFRLYSSSPFDLLVMDVPSNDNAELEAFRPLVHSLAVMVGIGHTVNTETSWIADTIIYQHWGQRVPISGAPGSTVLSGPDWLLVDPDSRNWRLPISQLGTELLVYFGAGFTNEYIGICVAELRTLLDRTQIVLTGPESTWENIWARRAAGARLVLASQGMAVYEALAVCTPVISISIDDEHRQDAKASAFIEHAGLMQDTDPVRLANMTVAKYSAISKRPAVPIDCMGTYRLAQLFLA